jgi:predicted GTPase
MAYGAGALAARELGAAELVDPRPYAAGSLADVFRGYPHLTEVLPAMGYSPAQLADLEATIAAVPCDLVVVASPIDLSRLIRIPQQTTRVTYAVEDREGPTIDSVIDGFVKAAGPGAGDDLAAGA